MIRGEKEILDITLSKVLPSKQSEGMNAHFQLALESLQGWGLEVCFKNSKAIILWKYSYGTLINVF